MTKTREEINKRISPSNTVEKKGGGMEVWWRVWTCSSYITFIYGIIMKFSVLLIYGISRKLTKPSQKIKKRKS
jgi:hypothetical protein